MTIRARIADDFAMGGIAVLIEDKGDGVRVRYAVDDGRVAPCEQITAEGVSLPPTLRLDEDVARALLAALANWYGGTSEAATARADLLHERGRVDRLTQVLAGLAEAVAGRIEREGRPKP